GPDFRGQQAHGHEAGDEVRRDQVERLVAEMGVEVGRVVQGGDHVGQAAAGDVDHLRGQVEAERPDAAGDDAAQLLEEPASADAQVEHAERGATRLGRVVPAELADGPLQGISDD